jgi:hypothetical protein
VSIPRERAAGARTGRSPAGGANTPSLNLAGARQPVQVTVESRVVFRRAGMAKLLPDQGIATSPWIWNRALLSHCAIVTVPCLITVAAGAFAPGHLGELTGTCRSSWPMTCWKAPGRCSSGCGRCPSRVGIYFVLAMTLFPGIGYLRVWDKMTAALEDLGLARPSEKALRELRRRLGPAPVKALFEAVAVPLAPPGTPGVFYRGMRTVAFDGLNSVKVPDSDRTGPGRARR